MTNMKKYLSILTFASACCWISCNSKSDSAVNPVVQKNLDAMHGVENCFTSKDFSHLDDFMAADAVDHAGDSGEIKGVENLKKEYTKSMANVDMKAEVIHELADSDFVMTWYHFTGKYTAPAMGFKAGDPIDLKSIELARFKDGKAVEHWSMMEPGDVVKMMASMKPPMPDMGKDATKKK
jgi:predicted ester cyclase